MGEMSFFEIDVAGKQDNWASFPSTVWQNTTGEDIAVTNIFMQMVGADQLVGELAAWLYTGKTFPADATSNEKLLASFGVEVYVNPSQPLIKEVRFNPGDQITVLQGAWLVFGTNAGPVNLPSGGTSPAISYVASVQCYYKKSGT